MGSASIIHGPESRPLAPGRSIFDEADEFALLVPATCDRSGRCHECIVEVVSGAEVLSPRAPAEAFLRDPYRLACQAVVERDDVDVEFRVLRRRLRILMPPDAPPDELDPLVSREGNEVRYDGDLLAVDDLPLVGLAVDVGTTTVVLNLVDFETGRSLGNAAFENPQRFGGSDVTSRIAYDALHPGELRLALRRALNSELRATYERLAIDRRAVREVYVVGNPTMRDMFFGLDVSGLGRQPFRSVTEQSRDVDGQRSTSIIRLGRDLGLYVHPRARVVGGPIIACHVGADAAADLVAVGLVDAVSSPEDADRRRVEVVVDIGTNTEIVVTDGQRILAASCPAGPAFEGGLVRSGMPGAAGAIDTVAQTDGALTFTTIGGVPPEGICGSGLVDLLAVLRRSGALTMQGRFLGDRTEVSIEPTRGITLSRSDVSHLAQAKAANAAGHRILLRALGVEATGIGRLHLAGGFANSLNVANAVDIGLLPAIAPDRVARAGNASIRGATALLLSRRVRDALDALCQRIEHVELENDRDFFDAFVDGCQLAPTVPLPPVVPA